MPNNNKKAIHIKYYAQFREKCGISEEKIETSVSSVRELYTQVKERYNLDLPSQYVGCAINGEVVDWEQVICEKDTVVFIPPVSGG